MTLFDVIERTTSKYTGKLVDETQAGIPSNLLNTLTLTLTDDTTGTIINSRNAQNVLNQNGVTVDTLGNLAWIIDPADNIVIGTGEYESHTALFEWTYGAKGGKHEVGLIVQNLRRVT